MAWHRSIKCSDKYEHYARKRTRCTQNSYSLRTCSISHGHRSLQLNTRQLYFSKSMIQVVRIQTTKSNDPNMNFNLNYTEHETRALTSKRTPVK
jgi:hypothetical protein